MKLDGDGRPVNDPESGGLRMFLIGKRYDQLGRFGVVGPLDVFSRKLGGAMRMRVVDGNELFAESHADCAKR